ncbi:MAG: hypothetical protein R3E86_00325 [Pseudomonadales bacterium]
MCAIGYFLESEGIMTTGISLVRENAIALAPPRTLWVSFPLGRPLGRPNDPDFQHRVIAAALDLLTRPAGPVLEDFPLDVPAADPAHAPSCPVSFAHEAEETDTWQAQLARELALLRPWYELGRRRRGRTTVGVSRSSIDDVFRQLGQVLDDDALPVTELKWFKLAIEDAKAFHSEALTAQPGEHDADRIRSALWHESRLGAALAALYDMFRRHPTLHPYARMVAPRVAVGGSTGEELALGPGNVSGTRTERE